MPSNATDGRGADHSLGMQLNYAANYFGHINIILRTGTLKLLHYFGQAP
jgi:hypothetical protein